MKDDVPASAGEERSSRRATDEGARSGRGKRSGTFVYPLPSTPLPSSTPLTSTPDPGTHRTSVGGSSIEGDPAGGVGAGISDEGTTLVSSTGTNGAASATGTTTEGLGAVASTPATPSRRNSMGVASVRIAARLAQNELSSRSARSGGDPMLDNDELLTLLGEYLVAGGLEKPELHVTLGGQPIVVDLQAPQRHAR